MEKEQDNIRGITLRVAIFFGLTTFTLCIAIFYIESILDDTRNLVDQKDSVIHVLRANLEDQQRMIKDNENEILLMKDKLNSISIPEVKSPSGNK